MKKLICVLISALTIFSSTLIGVFAEDVDETLALVRSDLYSLGDVDENDAVNAIDALEMKKSVAGYETAIPDNAADFDADGKVTSRDVFCLKSCLSGEKSISDYEGDKIVTTLKIAGNDISEYEIIVPDGTNRQNDNVYIAAILLQTYVKKLNGTTLPIVYKSNRTAEHAIVYNRFDPLAPADERMNLGIEDYKYDVTDGDLNIYGTLRGTMYATYEIIENELGVRFFSNVSTFVYKNRYVNLEEGTDVSFAPPLEFRFAGEPLNDIQKFYQTYGALRLNGTQLYNSYYKQNGYLTGPHYDNAHSYCDYWRMGTGTFPEEPYVGDKYYAKYLSGEKKDGLSWQPCTMSDEVYNTLFSGMLDALTMVQGWSHQFGTEYGICTSSFSINDNAEYCKCRTCRMKAAGKSTTIKGTPEEVKAFLDQYSAEYTLGAYTRGATAVTFKKEADSGIYLDLANRAAKDIREYYPGMRILTIVYDHTVPETVKPESNIVLFYCGHGCNQHILGTGECGDNLTVLGGSNKEDEENLIIWSDICHDAGATIWYWDYGVTYSTYLAPCPNIPNFYYDFKWLYDECSIDGIYYESCSGPHICFEDMKSYMSARMAWNPAMSYEEFTDIMKEYMYIEYGNGFEEVYEYMLLQTAAGDACEFCSVNNHDRPGDMYSYEYLDEHYEEMRDLLVTAIEKAQDYRRVVNCEELLLGCEFMGLSSAYDRMYTNGTAESRKTYEERYTWLYNYLNDNEIMIYGDDIYVLPDEIDFTVNPMIQFYGFGSWHEGVTP